MQSSITRQCASHLLRLLPPIASTAQATILCVFLAAGPLASEEHEPVKTPPISAAEVIDALQLEGHVEGGFYRRTYEAQDQPRLDTEQGERFSMTSIFYLLTSEGPVGHFHLNRSDIVHYFQLGDPIDYFLIHEDGQLETRTMGPDPRQGHLLQMTVPGGIWKASRLQEGDAGFGLISEAVSPGFDFSDMTLGETQKLLRLFPQHRATINSLSR
ncbi:MAG: cupin domain-containing protein [Congregibacter sp.]